MQVDHNLPEDKDLLHKHHEVLLVQRGTHKVRLGHEDWQGRYGDWVYLPPDTPHRPLHERIGKTALWVLQWDGDPLANATVLSGHDSTGRMAMCCRWLHDLDMRATPLQREQHQLAFHMVISLVREVGILEHRPTEAISRTCQFIRNNLDFSLDIASLATYAGMSERHLRRRFREAIGMSPKQYITAARLDFAQHALLHTTLTLKDIASHIGMSSGQQLSHFVRKHLGINARQIREGRIPKSTRVFQSDRRR